MPLRNGNEPIDKNFLPAAQIDTAYAFANSSIVAVTEEPSKLDMNYIVYNSMITFTLVPGTEVVAIEYTGWLLDRIRVLRNNWEGDSPILSNSETVYASKSNMKEKATELLKKVSKQVAVEYLAANLPD